MTWMNDYSLLVIMTQMTIKLIDWHYNWLLWSGLQVSMTVMFADDTAIQTTDEDQQTATNRFQRTINNTSKWTKRGKIINNIHKLVHVYHTLRKTIYNQVLLDQQIILQKDSVKYLGTHLDSQLDWKRYVCHKKIKVKNAKTIRATREALKTLWSRSYEQTSIVRYDNWADTDLWDTIIELWQ